MESDNTTPFTQQGAGNFLTVYGLEIQDPVLAVSARKVLTLAMVGGVFAIILGLVSFSVNPVPGTFGSGGLHVSIALLTLFSGCCVPACAYLGAKQADANCACAFCGCNCFGCVCTVFGMICIQGGLLRVKDIIAFCKPGAEQDQCSSPAWFETACQHVPGHEKDSPEACFSFFNDNYEALSEHFPFLVLVSVLAGIVQFCSFLYGTQFYSLLKERIVAPTIPVEYSTQTREIQPAH